MRKLGFSVLLLSASAICFWFSISMAVKMFNEPSPILSVAGLAGPTSSQIWTLFSIVGFILGLGILSYLISIWKSKH